MRMGDCNIIELEEGWNHIRKGIVKLKKILEGVPDESFSAHEYIFLYETIYHMCTQRVPYDYSQQLYERYKETFVEYIHSLVLPVLMEKHDEVLLRELVNRWNNHKIMVRWLYRFFNYLDRYFISRRSLPTLNEVGLTCFCDLVYWELKTNVRVAVISLIDREREGEQIDRALLKNVLGVFVEIGMGNMDCYENDFESAMLEDTTAYYSQKSASWILEYSCPDYMLKAEECLKREKERVSHYLHADSEQKLLGRVEHEFLSQFENQIVHHSLLKDVKKDDFSRMYSFFYRIPKGQGLIAPLFRQHVTDEGTTFVKQTEDAATNKKTFMWKVIELHDNYFQYVSTCSVNHSLFHKALKEAFEIFCEKGVAGNTIADLLASFCDNTWKKGSSEKLSDEAIEDTLEKMVKLLAFEIFCNKGVAGNTSADLLVYQELKTNVRDAVISLIDPERKGEQIDRALLKNVLGIFVEIAMGKMDCYDNDFESTLLEDTAAYYSQKAASWNLEDSCPDYILKVEECLKQEKERVSHYLHADSVQKLLGRVEHELLSQYENQLMEKEHSGYQSLLKDGKMDDLSRMYRFFYRIPKGLEPIAQFFKQYVTDEGETLVKQAEDAASNKKAFVWEVIELHDKYLQYVSTCFVNHSLFHKALKEAFEIFCNKGVAGNTIVGLLASFCDNILKKGSSEKLSDEAIEDTLEKVVNLLAYVGDKDLFSEFYRKKLVHRLIFDKSANVEHERSILTKLKQQYGSQFTSKMERMLTEFTLGPENQAKFQKYLKDNAHAHPGIELTVTVLTNGCWPSYNLFNLNLPAEMVKCVEVFKEFYQTQTKHQKLTWIYSLGTCNLSGNFNARVVDLTVTTFQGVALLVFNSAEKLSYSEIKSQLNLSDEDIVRLLHSLACAKHKILTK